MKHKAQQALNSITEYFEDNIVALMDEHFTTLQSLIDLSLQEQLSQRVDEIVKTERADHPDETLFPNMISISNNQAYLEIERETYEGYKVWKRIKL